MKMIEQVNRADYVVTDYRKELSYIELAWYATHCNGVLGVVIEDRRDKTFSWIMWADEHTGYVTADLAVGLTDEEEATAQLHKAMEEYV
jgi:N-acetylglucosamine-6-phosphate deacetylase